eukprot:13890661-Heterocapsa_arctica.AAC.1
MHCTHARCIPSIAQLGVMGKGYHPDGSPEGCVENNFHRVTIDAASGYWPVAATGGAIKTTYDVEIIHDVGDMLEHDIRLYINPCKAVVVVHPNPPNEKTARFTEYSGSCGAGSIRGMVMLRNIGEFPAGTCTEYETGKRFTWAKINGVKMTHLPDAMEGTITRRDKVMQEIEKLTSRCAENAEGDISRREILLLLLS